MYIGNDLQIAHPSYRIIDDISSGFDGSATSFALNVSGATPVPFPISTQQVMISVNGVVQEPDPTGSAGFKLLGSNIVFSSAPANGHAFFGVINAGADYVTAGSEFPDGSATAPSFTFQDDQDTGWFRSGSGAVGYSANGVQTLTFDGNGLTVTGDATFTGDSSKNMFWDKSDGALEFADNAKATFGTGGDLSIYHSSSNSQNTIKSINGRINFNASETRMEGADGSELIGRFIENGAVELYHNNVKKFETTSTGGTLTGTLVADGLTVDTSTLKVDATNNRVGIGTASPQTQLHLVDSANPVIRLEDADDNNYHHIFCDSANFIISADRNDAGSGILIFRVGGTNERMRIDSAGRLLIGTTTEGHANGDDLTIATTANTGITLRSGTSNNGNIFFSDATSGGAEYEGMIWYAHGTNSMRFATAQTEALVLDSSQNATFAGKITANATGTGLHLVSTSTESNLLLQNDARTWKIVNYDYGTGADNLGFHDGSGDRLIISHTTGNATFGGTVSDSKGNLRSIPENARGTAYTLVASDAGKCVTQTHSGGVNCPYNTFSKGDAITIINHSGSDIAIVQGANNTMYNAADGSTGNKTLSGRGMATVWYQEHNVCYISGAGLS